MCLLNYETLVDPLLRDVREYTPGFSGMQPGNRVVDICCGTGAQAIQYAYRGIITIGVDNSPSMLNIALKNKIKHELGNVSFYLADATRLPFVNNWFDYASVSMGLHDKERAIRYRVVSEMMRIVKQDGALLFIDYAIPLVKSIWGGLSFAIEFLAGGGHYRGFQDYVTSGGLENILKVFHLHEVDRDYLKGGLIVIVKARLSERSSFG